MPVRYFLEEVQKQVQEALKGGSVDILHISEFFGIRPELELQEGESAEGWVQLDEDYQVGQLVAVMFGDTTDVNTENLTEEERENIRWTPVPAKVKKQGHIIAPDPKIGIAGWNRYADFLRCSTLYFDCQLHLGGFDVFCVSFCGFRYGLRSGLRDSFFRGNGSLCWFRHGFRCNCGFHRFRNHRLRDRRFRFQNLHNFRSFRSVRFLSRNSHRRQHSCHQRNCQQTAKQPLPSVI